MTIKSNTSTIEERFDPDAGMPRFEEPNWTKIPVERKRMRELQQRSNVPGLVHFGLFIGLLAVFGTLTVLAEPLWLKAVFFLLYATVFGFSEPILHETHHRTPFRTVWLNEVVHYISGMLAFKEPLRDRWLHAGHHTYTYYSEIDPEITTERPPSFWTLPLDFMRIHFVLVWLKITLQTAFVGLDDLGKRWVPKDYQKQAVWSARFFIVYYLSVIALAIVLQSWYPILFIFVARVLGAWLHSWLSFIQHPGLEENVPDWRQNTRTVRMNRIIRVFYWNMNYHVEHHMYPTVPFRALGDLHEEVKAEMPEPYRNTWVAWKEMMRALWTQRKDPSFSVHRPIPGGTPADSAGEGPTPAQAKEYVDRLKDEGE